ncbi:MAG: hypothetical protein ACRC4L_01055, partial [Mycoplasma sp.]
HMFKIKRDLEVGMKVGLNVKNTHADYEITDLDSAKKYLSVKWEVENDLYNLEFEVKKFGSKHSIIKFRQYLKRDKTFFGLADYAGLVIYRRSFKQNMKAFVSHIKYLQAGDFEPRTISHVVRKKLEGFSTQDIFQYLYKAFKQLYKIKGEVTSGYRFKFANEEALLKYRVDEMDSEERRISLSWENLEIQNEIILAIVEENGAQYIKAERKMTCSPELFKIYGKGKLRTYRSVFNENVKDLHKYMNYLKNGNAELEIKKEDQSINLEIEDKKEAVKKTTSKSSSKKNKKKG